jgi:large subunit ribosomal protein L4
MELNIVNIKGEDTGRKVSLNDAVFGIEPNDHAIYLDVKLYMANQRQGTHSSKGRSQLSGSTRKLGKQKGGGGARPGDIKSGIRVGGGRMFGPTPRDYNMKLNKKVKQLARRSALSYKALNNEITVVENLNFAAPKTKDFVAMAKSLQVADKKPLIILANANKNVYLSARNLSSVKVVTVSELSTYIVLNAKTLVLTEEAVAAVEQIFKA